MKKTLKIIGLSLLVIIVIFAVYFFSIRYLDSKVLEIKNYVTADKKQGGKATIIPTHFVDGERFYFKIPIGEGDSILGFGDTGGGISMLMPETKNNILIHDKIRTGIFKGLMPMQYVLFSDIVKDPLFPKPFPLRRFVLRNPFMRVSSPYLVIPGMDRETKLMAEVQPEMEAFLGQTFFMHKSWTIDYPNEQIWLNTPLNESQIVNPNVQKIGFKKNKNKDNIYGHASMTIVVAGDTIDVLFDTGATIILSEEGKKQLDTDKKTIGGSFIAASIFDKWRKEHPEWKYYSKADLSGDIIEVPIVTIGGYEVGPVLFAKRPDKNWSEYMISSMDKIVKGAIGGSGLKYLKVTIDYNSELIKFEK